MKNIMIFLGEEIDMEDRIIYQGLKMNNGREYLVVINSDGECIYFGKDFEKCSGALNSTIDSFLRTNNPIAEIESWGGGVEEPAKEWNKLKYETNYRIIAYGFKTLNTGAQK